MEENPQQAPKTTAEDDFFGEDDGESRGPDMAERDHKARQKEFWTMGYQEAFGENKETKLQEGFERGFQKVFEDSRAIGRKLGRVVAMEMLQKKEQSSSDSDELDETESSRNKIVQEAIRSVSEYARFHEEESQRQKDAAGGQGSFTEKKEEDEDEDLPQPSTTLLLAHLTELTRQIERKGTEYSESRG